MADLSNVVAVIGQLAQTAVYPNGTRSASVINADVQIVADWPLASMIDTMMANNQGIVSVYPTGGNSSIYQVVDDSPYLVTPATHGMTATIAGEAVTLAGAPGAGEFATIVVNKTIAYSRTGSSAAAILAAIEADAQTAFPGVSVSGNTITFPTSAHSLLCRIGATATAGRVTHRQREMITVTAWASTPTARDALAAAVDVYLKMQNRLDMPDGTQAVMAAVRSAQRDEKQAATVYRRDLVFSVDYATIQQYAVVEITTFGATLDSGPSLIGHVADDAISS